MRNIPWDPTMIVLCTIIGAPLHQKPSNIQVTMLCSNVKRC